MEEARKKLRLCLLLVVAAAVIVGMIYYFGDVKKSGDMSEGTLVKQTGYGRYMAGAAEIMGRNTECAADIGGSYGIWQ